MTAVDVGPARAEALARANPVRRVHTMTAVVVIVGLAVTAGLVLASWIVHDHNEDRLLRQRVHEAVTVAASSIGGLQGQLATASVAAEAGPGDAALFRQVMQPLVAKGGRFVSASVWPLGAPAPQPSAVVGAPPELSREGAARIDAYLAAAAKRPVLSIRDLLGSDNRRLGYAYAVPGARSVVYVEAALPKNRKARIASDSAFADLDYALYLGRGATPTHLLASSSGTALTGGRQASDTLPFGNSELLLVVSNHHELGGAVLAALPWVLAALGLLLTFVAAFLTERLIRRRMRAEELSDRLEEVAEENAALYTSQREIAQQLQRSLMPQSLPRLDGLEASGRYEAGVVGIEVGGDWYDVLPLSETRLVFSVGDVCGRGLAAAVLMASLRYSMRAYALEQADPATILDKLTAIVGASRDDTFATVICGMLDTARGTLTVARAGHPDLLAVDHDGARYLETPLGPPVGVDPDWVYQSVTISLPDDVTLVAFTDGLVERRREHLDTGLERLRLAATADMPIASLVEHVVDTLAPEGSDDDIAVLGLRWTRRRPTVVPDPVPADPAEAAARAG
jgi:serine phosphatase RsbU (regulator of sigma subunit)